MDAELNFIIFSESIYLHKVQYDRLFFSKCHLSSLEIHYLEPLLGHVHVCNPPNEWK